MSFNETELGMIPDDWEVKQIGEIGKVVGGGTPKTKIEEYWNGNISWITPKDLSGYSDRFIYKGERSITKVGLENSSAKLLSKGTVLFSSRAPIGYVAIAGKDVSTNQGFKSIVCNERVTYNLFLYYLMKQKKTDIEMIAGGSTFKEVSGKVVKEFKIQIPPLTEQKAIANILSTLDEKIEINNRINKDLEEMAQIIFKHWFVDFEFPNEEGKPYKSSGGEMVESELGLIPKGWKVKAIEETLDFVIGGDWGKEKENDDFSQKIYCIRGADFPDLQNGNKADIPIRYIKENSFKKRNLLDGDIILEISGGTKGRPTGRTIYIHKGMINDYDNVLSFSNFCRVMRTNSVLDSKILYLYLQFLYDSGVMETHQVQSTGISNFQFKSFIASKQVVISDKGIQDKFSGIIEKLYQKKNTYESYRLKLIRDNLLPKLMSGEIRVPLKSKSDAL
ncbi:MAG: restriction endonuclease subunit S [Parabacteroides sp.]